MSPTAAKYAPAALLPMAGALPFDWLFVPFVALGLVAAWMVRAGQRVATKEDWREIRRDLIVSLLIGGGNAIIAAVAIRRFDLDYMEGMGVAFFLALGGVETMKLGWGAAKKAWSWFIDRWFESEGLRRQAAAKKDALEAAHRKGELYDLARQFDAPPAPPTRAERRRRAKRPPAE